MDLVSHAKITIAGPLQCLDFFMMDWRVNLAWTNYREGGIVYVAVAYLIWTIGACGSV